MFDSGSVKVSVSKSDVKSDLVGVLLVSRQPVPHHVMYEVHGAPHLTEDRVPVFPRGCTARMPQTGLRYTYFVTFQ